MKYIKLACIQAIKESKKIRTASAYQVRKELNATTLIPFANQIVKHGSLFGLTSTKSNHRCGIFLKRL